MMYTTITSLNDSREAQITCSLQSPHIVTALAHSGSLDRTAWLALEYIAGGDLQQALQQQGMLPEIESLLLMRQLAAGSKQHMNKAFTSRLKAWKHFY